MKNSTNSSVGKVYLKVKARKAQETVTEQKQENNNRETARFSSPVFTLSPEQYWAGPSCYFNNRKK